MVKKEAGKAGSSAAKPKDAKAEQSQPKLDISEQPSRVPLTQQSRQEVTCPVPKGRGVRQPVSTAAAPNTNEAKAKPEDMDTILESVKLARENSKQRKFEQTWDFVINLKGLDLKKPENRFSTEVTLPKGRGKIPKIAVFSDITTSDAKKFADLVIPKDEIEILAADKKRMKDIADSHDFFFSEPQLMPAIGKSLGTVLGPRGKVPRPLPPKGNLEPLLNAAKRMVRIAVKETPVIHAVVGSEKMSNEDVADNIRAVYSFVRDKLPKGKNNIRSVLIKLTMGKPVKIVMK